MGARVINYSHHHCSPPAAAAVAHAVPTRWIPSLVEHGEPGPGAGVCGRKAGAWEKLSTPHAKDGLTLHRGHEVPLSAFLAQCP